MEGWPPQIRGRSREELAWKEREGEEEGEERRGREDPASAMARSLGREKTGVCIDGCMHCFALKNHECDFPKLT